MYKQHFAKPAIGAILVLMLGVRANAAAERLSLVQDGRPSATIVLPKAPTQIEKSTVDINKRGLQPRWMKSRSASSDIQIQRDATSAATPAPEPPQRPEASMAAVAIPPQAAEDKSFDRPYEIPDEMPPATVVGPTCDPTDPDCEACQ